MGWVKGLIAVTCIALMSGIGYLILANSSDRRNSGKGPRLTLTSTYCQERLAQIRLGRTRSDDIPVLGECFVKGLVRQSDVVGAFKAGTKKRNGG